MFGADLIAEKNKNRFAVSVKTRLFRENSTESLVFVVDEQHLKKLEHFAIQFGNMIPLFALVVCIANENTIHLIISRTDELRKNLPKVKFGYSLRFTKTMREKLINMPFIDYSCWANEKLGDKDFTSQDAEDDVFQTKVTR